MPHLRESAPYPWPYDGVLDARRVALLVAGAQPAWAAVSRRVPEVTAVIGEVAAVLAPAGAHIVAVRHVAGGAGRPCPLPPAANHPSVVLLAGLPAFDVVVEARGTNGFHGSALDAELRARGIDRLVVTGFGGEAAVDSTLRSANDRGYECLTLVDGVAPFDEDLFEHALSSITMSGGIFGAIGTSADLTLTLSDHLSLEHA